MRIKALFWNIKYGCLRLKSVVDLWPRFAVGTCSPGVCWSGSGHVALLCGARQWALPGGSAWGLCSSSGSSEHCWHKAAWLTSSFCSSHALMSWSGLGALGNDCVNMTLIAAKEDYCFYGRFYFLFVCASTLEWSMCMLLYLSEGNF